MDRSDFPAPEEGLLLTHFIVVSDVERSREFYRHLLEATVIVEENPKSAPTCVTRTGT